MDDIQDQRLTMMIESVSETASVKPFILCAPDLSMKLSLLVA